MVVLVCDFQNIRTEAGAKAAEIAPKIGKKGLVWVPSRARTSGGYFAPKPEPNLQTIMGNLAMMEQTVLEYKFAVANGAHKPKKSKKSKDQTALNQLKLKLAEAKMTLLAGYIRIISGKNCFMSACHPYGHSRQTPTARM